MEPLTSFIELHPGFTYGALAPTRHGLPLDIFAFTRQTDLADFSNVQTSIFNHLVAMVALFDLRLYQTHQEV